MQVSIAAAAAAAAANSVDDDAKGNDCQLTNDTATEFTDSQRLTHDERNFQSATDDSRKTPTSAEPELALQPFGSEYNSFCRNLYAVKELFDKNVDFHDSIINVINVALIQMMF